MTEAKNHGQYGFSPVNMLSAGLIRPLYRQCTKDGTGNNKQGYDAGNRTLCPSRTFSQARKTEYNPVPVINYAVLKG